jgi:hypothetical protein
MRGFVRLIRIGFQDVRYPTVQPTQLFLEFLDLGVVGFCGHLTRQFIQIVKGKTIKRPSARAGYDAQTVR